MNPDKIESYEQYVKNDWIFNFKIDYIHKPSSPQWLEPKETQNKETSTRWMVSPYYIVTLDRIEGRGFIYADTYYINQLHTYRQINLRKDGKNPQSVDDLGIECHCFYDFVMIKKTMMSGII